MNLIIDIGNTFKKYALFSDGKISEQDVFADWDFLNENFFFKNHPQLKKTIISSVTAIPTEFITELKKHSRLHLLDEKTKLPFVNLYMTPETLGRDRIAGLAGAWALFPGRNILIIDAGTCITTDFLSAEGKYSGGSISPGISMRFKALHNFTGKLPLINLRKYENNSGNTTETSILAGVVGGTIDEIDTKIKSYKKQYKNLKVLLCGGDSDFLAGSLKSSIFANPNLVLTGLNELLEYNEK